jgi:hypothetical protein
MPVASKFASSQLSGPQVVQQRNNQTDTRAQSSIHESFLSRMQDTPDTIRLIFDEFQRGAGDDAAAVEGGSGVGGSREETLRLALQKKRWIEMQLHEVSLVAFCLMFLAHDTSLHVVFLLNALVLLCDLLHADWQR